VNPVGTIGSARFSDPGIGDLRIDNDAGKL
jgi:hypothetical protein